MKKYKKYSYNKEYFNTIDTPHKAYIYGLLWADGYAKGSKLQIELSIKDIELINLIYNEIGGLISTRHRMRSRFINDCCSKEFTMVSWYVSSKELVNSLLDNGFRQTSHLINKQFINAFLLGFFDGDGSIIITKNNTVQVSFSGSKNANWNWFYNAVNRIGTFCFTEHKNINKTGVTSGSHVRIFGKEAIRFLNLLQVDNLGLNRKKNKLSTAVLLYKTKRNSSVRRITNRIVL